MARWRNILLVVVWRILNWVKIISSYIMTHWRNILWAVWKILLWMPILFLASKFFLSDERSLTVSAIITTYIISHCFGYLFILLNQAPNEFSFADDELPFFARNLLRIEHRIRWSTFMAIGIGIFTTFLPRQLMTTIALCYLVGFCVGKYYLFSLALKSRHHGPEKKTKPKGKPKKKKNKKKKNQK